MRMQKPKVPARAQAASAVGRVAPTANAAGDGRRRAFGRRDVDEDQLAGRKDPRKLGAKCAECPFAKGGRAVKPVYGEGPPNPVGLLVGEGPGREEAEQGRPFVGATGRQLDVSLTEAGLRRANLFIVNATCCRPPEGKTESMMRKATVACHAVFLRQLRGFKEDIPVLAMGKWAHFALTGKDKKAMSARGFIRWEFVLPHEPTFDDVAELLHDSGGGHLPEKNHAQHRDVPLRAVGGGRNPKGSRAPSRSTKDVRENRRHPARRA